MPASASSTSTGAPRRGRARLQHGRPHHQRHVRDVDVAAGGEEPEVEARQHQHGGDAAHERREGDLAEPVDAPDQPQEGREDHRDPQPVAALAEQRQQRAGGDRQRMLGRHPEALEARLREVEHLLAPQQRVVRVVVGIGRVDEEPDGEGQAQQRRTRRARSARRRATAHASERGPPGEGQAFHGRYRMTRRYRLSAPTMKLIIQIPCLNEEETLPVTLADLPREIQGFDERRVADHRRRLDRPDRRGRARARRRPHRPPDQQQGARLGLPGRPRRGAQARRRRDRQHRRRQPVLRARRRAARGSRSWPATPTWWSATARS